MNNKQWRGALAALFSILALLAATPSAFADPGNMMGDDDGRPGMMGPGYGPGMMGPGYGSGMMGPGMMGPGGGPGMMGGCGMGMMPMHLLDLSDEQRKQYNAIATELHRQNWARMGKVMELSLELKELYWDEPPDSQAIGKTYAEISDLQRQMIEAQVTAHNKLNELLTDKQRERMRGLCRGGMGGMSGMGGMHRGMMGN